MKNRLLFSFVVVISFGSCKKDSVIDVPSNLTGQWSWIRSCGGIAGICYTPISTKARIRIVFATDSIYQFYRNDTLKVSDRFHVYKLNSADDRAIKYDNSSNGQTYFIRKDTLFLNDFCCDGYSQIYKRMNGRLFIH